MEWKCSPLFRRQMCPHPKGPATAKSSIVTGIVARLKPWQLTLILNIFNGLLIVGNEESRMWQCRLSSNRVITLVLYMITLVIYRRKYWTCTLGTLYCTSHIRSTHKRFSALHFADAYLSARRQKARRSIRAITRVGDTYPHIFCCLNRIFNRSYGCGAAGSPH